MRYEFRNRRDAGRELAQRLAGWGGRDDVIILALPRGGVPVADEIARELDAPLDVLLVRKLGVPGHEELAMGAIASGGVRMVNDEVIGSLRLPLSVIDEVAEREQRELERRERAFRDDLPPPAVSGRVVILVDDGLATGATMRVAIEALRLQSPGRIVVAVPVGSPDTVRSVALLVDEVVCLLTPESFFAVGQWYGDFSQVTDADVRAILAESRRVAIEQPEDETPAT
ncbi:MAG TPA: phosphoribosyltransferase [Chloroflexi bacterium]|nr:phosphoribosyltransferase [Chloroflexota bacterium]HRA32248.1 phosphoribosyltransferase [Thermomicrobiales bacterium]